MTFILFCCYQLCRFQIISILQHLPPLLNHPHWFWGWVHPYQYQIFRPLYSMNWWQNCVQAQVQQKIDILSCFLKASRCWECLIIIHIPIQVYTAHLVTVGRNGAQINNVISSWWNYLEINLQWNPGKTNSANKKPW